MRVFLVCLVLLTGCTALQNMRSPSPTERWLVGCNAIASAKRVMSTKKLDVEATAKAYMWFAVVDPICKANEAPADASLIDTLEQGVLALQAEGGK